MRWKLAIVAGALAPLTGCSIYKLAAHNLANEPVQYADEQNVERRLRHDAERVWKAIACQYPYRTFSKEFEDGFVTGYADYLDSGGKPTPPLVPPLKYRRSKYLCPAGHALVRDYFAGFKYGTEVACAGGQRQYLTVPVLIPVAKPEAPLNIQTGAGQTMAMPPPPPLPSEETTADGTIKPAAPLGPPQPIPVPSPVPSPAPTQVLPGFGPPPGSGGSGGGATLPRIEVPDLPPANTPPARSGPGVPAGGKIRPAAAVEVVDIPAAPAAAVEPADMPAVADPPPAVPAVGEPPR